MAKQQIRYSITGKESLPFKYIESISSSEDSKIPKISLDNEVIKLEKDNSSKSIRELES